MENLLLCFNNRFSLVLRENQENCLASNAPYNEMA